MYDLGAPQWSLLGSLVLYPTIYIISLPPASTLRRIAQSREAISLAHVTLQTILSFVCLWRHSDVLIASKGAEHIKPNESDIVPIIATRSTFAECITAIEAGYLVQDSLILLEAYRLRQKATENAPRIKGWNFLHLGVHHAVLGGLLLILQYHIAQGREKGILVIVVLHLMNASSIFGTIKWFIINFWPTYPKLRLLTTILYLTTFAIARIYVVLWALLIYGRQTGPTMLEALQTLPSSCRIGTGGILAANTWWLATRLRNLLLELRDWRKN